jgi:hypothetical protein
MSLDAIAPKFAEHGILGVVIVALLAAALGLFPLGHETAALRDFDPPHDCSGSMLLKKSQITRRQFS